ncbi:hypothetical protein WICMUC_000647 [Wickerhamomyces mucosus]|uniref:Lariat debranching enzyme C-terminal domain-containing protein n=1 Tax=Wickerhamomyces mucosus TaxID=1378264 RepID=A0A9P8PZ46_9ASCO|nr:hypothetical protein WICMUC_000647 [Wickerhamomyces mucosus]
MTIEVNIAIEGCCHGELDKIYAEVNKIDDSRRPELLIICGDFQSLRSEKDLYSISVPDKYKQLGDFHSYYNKEKVAPITTIFIGGNHEASNYLSELPYGGWVAPNIYYMGYSNVIWYKGIKIGGISGIYKSFDFYKPHYEKIPLNERSIKSIYHTRFEDYLKMSLIKQRNLNCFLSHDWPVNITNFGDLKTLLKIKPFFKRDISGGQLGSYPNWLLLKKLRPSYWFSAHLHVAFDATVKHENKRKLSGTITSNEPKNDNEIVLELNDELEDTKIKENSDETNLDNPEGKAENKDVENPKNEISLHLDHTYNRINPDEVNLELEEELKPKVPAEEISGGFSHTTFLALDKCLPKRKFLQVLKIPISTHESANTDSLYYDEEYVKINQFFETFRSSEFFKNLKMNDINEELIEQLQKEIINVKITDDFVVPQNFESNEENPMSQTKAYVERFFSNFESS